jgi:murein DD-endopeptidase MepM/ murein hydrolase activator NlpD
VTALFLGLLLAGACWAPPVDAAVIDPFREPACVWCPGNRGLEYGTAPGVQVRAVASGEVSFAGRVAGVGYVVVRHVDGLRATYGGIRSQLRTGMPVVAAMVVGITEGTLHFGLRRGGDYLDPAPFLGEAIGRARLVPLDGAAPRPVSGRRWRCARTVAPSPLSDSIRSGPQPLA